jgi:hypothetical protein
MTDEATVSKMEKVELRPCPFCHEDTHLTI